MTTGMYNRVPQKGQGAQTSRVPVPQNQDLEAIIVKGDAERLVDWAEKVGKALASHLKTSQIRNVFGTVRRIENEWARGQEQAARRQLLLLKPKLAYYARRDQSGGVRDLESVLRPAIDLIKGDKQRFAYFVDFFEAILAYHRAFEGRD